MGFWSGCLTSTSRGLRGYLSTKREDPATCLPDTWNQRGRGFEKWIQNAAMMGYAVGEEVLFDILHQYLRSRERPQTDETGT